MSAKQERGRELAAMLTEVENRGVNTRADARELLAIARAAVVALQDRERAPALQRAGRRARTPDAPMVVAVKRALLNGPTVLRRDLGALYGIDGGRVSEIARGQKDHLLP